MKFDKSVQLEYLATRPRSYGYAMGQYVPATPQYSPKQTGLEKSLDVDPLALMSANKLELGRLKIGLLAGQIAHRKYVHEKILDSVETDELVCSNEILQREAMQDYDGVQKIRLDQLLRLERERRSEQSDFFKYYAKISKDLIEAVLEYQSMFKTGEILEKM